MSEDHRGVIVLHTAELLTLALEAMDRAERQRDGDPTVMAADALTSVVMAAAAAEAFINELDAAYEGRDGADQRESETAAAIVAVECERPPSSTVEKYLQASLRLSGREPDKGGEPFQSFSRLITVRDACVHAKPLDSLVRPKSQKSGDDYRIMEPPKFLRDFVQLGMTVYLEEPGTVSWCNLLQTERVAAWACRAAIKMMLFIVEVAPQWGLIASVRRQLSDHYLPWANRIP